MLADIGMGGRYSNEKARKIKEERELAADLEAVQQGAKAWGADSGETMKTRSSRTSEAPAKTRKVYYSAWNCDITRKTNLLNSWCGHLSLHF